MRGEVNEVHYQLLERIKEESMAQLALSIERSQIACFRSRMLDPCSSCVRHRRSSIRSKMRGELSIGNVVRTEYSRGVE